MKTLSLVIIAAMLSGCYTVGSFNKGDILHELPFATAMVNGTPAEAAICVGKYWQAQNGGDIGNGWQVWTYPYQVEVASPIYNSPGPLVSLVIEFRDQGGKTIATAYCHRAYSKDRPQQTVTLKAFEACKARENAKVEDESFQTPVNKAAPNIAADPHYRNIKAIVLKNGDVIEGQIISVDVDNNDVLKIRTKEGKISSYSMNDLKEYIYK